VQGSTSVAKVREVFEKVADCSKKSDGLIEEIVASSHEQSAGAGQINGAVAEMDTIVQQNATNAKQSALISEQLNALAEQMKSFVAELTALAGAAATDAGRLDTVHKTKKVEKGSPRYWVAFRNFWMKKVPFGKNRERIINE
jgi:methyl-accepting chemotaxis protein